MNKAKLKKPLVDISNHIVDEQNFSTEHDDCIMCNKAIRGESKYMIHSCDGSIGIICSNDDGDYVEQNDAGDMGYWSVGSECVKKLKKSFFKAGLKADDYIYDTTKPKAKPKKKTKSWNITEEDTLVLWRALEKYTYKVDGEEYEKASLLLAKVIHKSCSFAGTLDEGETVKSIYKGMGF